MGNSKSKKKKQKASKKKHPLHHLWEEKGMYPNIQWSSKDLQTMVLNGNFAPLIPGSDDPIPDERILSECPICFLYYSECAVNVASCCSKPMCSQCYCSVQVSPESKPASCPYCTSANFNVAPMVQGVQHPERYGLHERAFARTIQLIQTQSLQNEESLAQQQTTESRQTPSGSISVAQRFEQQELMTDLSDLAEVDRITSPTIAPYHLSPSSQPSAAPARRPTSPMADMSLGGGRGRMNSNERDAWQRNQLAALLGSTSGAGRAAQNNSQVRLAIEQMMMEEAIRLSMADAGGGGGGGAPPPRGQQKSTKQFCHE
jgi:hypothetical protein